MRNVVFIGLLCLELIMCSCDLMDKDQDTTMSAEGYVLDKLSQAPMSNVRVSIIAEDFCFICDFNQQYTVATAYTDQNGYYKISYSDPNYYSDNNDNYIQSIDFEVDGAIAQLPFGSIPKYDPVSIGADMGNHIKQDIFLTPNSAVSVKLNRPLADSDILRLYVTNKTDSCVFGSFNSYMFPYKRKIMPGPNWIWWKTNRNGVFKEDSVLVNFPIFTLTDLEISD